MRAPFHLSLIGATCLIPFCLAQNGLDMAALQALPLCVARCLNQTLPAHDCTVQQPCFCDSTELQGDMLTCMKSSGCSFAEKLTSKKFQTNLCNIPVRNRGQSLAIVTYVLFGIACLLTLARLISGLPMLKGRGFEWDDYVAIFCLAPLGALTAAVYYAVQSGMGTDIWGLSASAVSSFTMWFYIGANLFTFVVFIGKVSLVCFYLRVWHGRDDFRLVCWITMLFLICALISFQVLAIIQCLPIRNQWLQFVDATSAPKCIDRQMWAWGIGGTDTGLNVLVMLMPLPKLWSTNFSSGRKLGIFAVYVVALAVTAMSVLRIFYIRGITSSPNFTYNLTYVGLYSSTEAYLIQICCCMPATSGLIRRSYQWSAGKLSRSDSTRSIIHHPHLEVDGNKEPQLEPGFISDVLPPPDLEKAKQSEDSGFIDDSAPSPIVQRSSAASNQASQLHKQRSFDPPWKNSARLTGETNTTSSSWRTPDILYHDRQNQLRLEIHDPASEPIKANLTYVDRFDGKHDIELQGHARKRAQQTRFAPDRQNSSETTTSTTGDDSTTPSASPSSSSSELDANPLPIAGRPVVREKRSESRIDQLLRAHRALTEGTSLAGLEMSLPESMKKKRKEEKKEEEKSGDSAAGMEKNVAPPLPSSSGKSITTEEEEEPKTNSQDTQGTTGGVGVRLSKADFF